MNLLHSMHCDALYGDVDMAFDTARFAVARTPDNGVIKYKRFAGDPDYEINFPAMEAQFGWLNCLYFNDLAAAAFGVKALNDGQTKCVINATLPSVTNNKIIISVGTGVGHAGITDTQILQTAGGHYLLLSPDEHQALMRFIRQRKI